MDEKFTKARNLRKEQTEQEKIMWSILRNRKFYGLRFKRQVPLGSYIVDFCCNEKKIVIEIDGGQHNEPSNISYDKQRTEFLETEGYKVIRFWNNDVSNNLEGIYQKLQKEIIDC
jgi:very-short-patch-repair endonuclease